MSRFATQLALGALVVLLAAVAEAKVALVGPTGGKAKVVKRDLGKLLSELDELVSEEQFAGGKRRPAKARALPGWIASRWAEAEVDLVIVAELRGRKLRLVSYLREEAAGETSYTLSRKYLLVGKTRALAGEWLRGQLEAAKQRAEQEAAALAKLAEPDEPPEPPEVIEPPASARPVEKPAPQEPRSAAGNRPGFLGDALGVPEDGPPLVVLSLDLAGLSRGFGYNDPITPNLRPYHNYFMPTFGGTLELSPLGLTGSSGLAGLGIFARFHTSFGSSAREGGPSYPTSHTALGFGVQYRANLGALVLIPAVSYQLRSFELKAADDGTEETELPDVDYAGVEGALGLEVPLGSSLALLAGGAFTRVMSTGEIISTAFHRGGTANAIAGSAGVRVGLAENLALEAGVIYQHYFYDFTPQPGDRFVAGGALDQYVTARAALRISI